MNQSRFRHKRIFTIYIPLTLFLLFLLLPFIWTIITSIKPEEEIITRPIKYLPTRATFEHYATLFNVLPFGKYFKNSLIVASGAALLSLVVSTSAAYSVSRYRFQGRRLAMLLFLCLNMFPVVLLLIPLFVIFRSFQLLDTYFSLILAYSTYAIPFAAWMLTGFFNSIPNELEEAAMVDGCTQGGAFIRVTLPIAAPALAATLIYIFIYAWNEFLFAVTFSQSNATRTLPVGLETLIGQHTMNWGLLTAGGIASSIPVIILFSFIQKYMVQGLTAGAVKG